MHDYDFELKIKMGVTRTRCAEQLKKTKKSLSCHVAWLYAVPVWIVVTMVLVVLFRQYTLDGKLGHGCFLSNLALYSGHIRVSHLAKIFC